MKIFIPLFILLFSSCITIGKHFPAEPIASIKPGTTTRDEVKEKFGPPTRVGLEDGLNTWTYMDYYLTVIGKLRVRDLFIKFDPQGKVVRYSYNTNEDDSKKE